MSTSGAAESRGLQTNNSNKDHQANVLLKRTFGSSRTMAMAMAKLLLSILALFLNGALCHNKNAVEFGYGKGTKGPSNWANLKPEWGTCATGLKQSPIDLVAKNMRVNNSLGPPQVFYHLGSGTIENHRYEDEIKFLEPSSHLTIDGITYNLAQFHFHVPSEHHVNGTRYPMEMHLVHSTPDKMKLAVISLLFVHGRRDHAFLAQLKEFDNTTKMSSTLSPSPEPVNMTKLQIGDRYYRYIGSLTTPPCTEGITWTIMEKIQKASTRQIKKVEKLLQNSNARPLQKTHGRTILRMDL